MEVVVGSTLLRASVFPATDVRGQDHLVIAVKGAWSLPKARQRPRPIEPTPLLSADVYYGEPGLSAMRCSHDLARFKPACDILFDACAHAPEGRAVRALGVRAQVGGWSKQLKVVGARIWKKALMGYDTSAPQAFTSMPLHYGFAFGGDRVYRGAQDQMLTEVYASNPVGIGWGGSHTLAQVADQPAPCLEDLSDAVTRPDGKHKAMALNPIGAHWPERQRFGGTYDAQWRAHVFPFLPEDFDERFHQAAPADQQVPFLQGGEAVQLANLVQGEPQVQFHLPALNKLQVRVLRKDYSIEVPAMNADTLFFETEAKRFSVVWRASVPIRRRIQEFDTIAVGPVDEQWWAARSLGLADGCGGCNQPIDFAAEELA